MTHQSGAILESTLQLIGIKKYNKIGSSQMTWNDLFKSNMRFASLLTFVGASSWVFCSYLAWSISEPGWWKYGILGLLCYIIFYFLLAWNPETGFEREMKDD
jgi:hypothetical protein